MKSEERIDVDGKRIGEARYYFEDGKLYQTASFLHDSLNGEKCTFYSSGKLQDISTFRNGIKNGTFVSYYENGKVSAKGEYKLDKKNGPFITYRNDGTPELANFYEDDVKTGFAEYDSAGVVKRSSVVLKMTFLKTKDFSAGKNIPIQVTVKNSSPETNSDSLRAFVMIRNGNDSTVTRFPLTKDSTWIYNYTPKIAGKYFITSSVADYVNVKSGIIYKSKMQAEFIVK